jgi:Gluconate 2-dehydrogenase subunit 3
LKKKINKNKYMKRRDAISRVALMMGGVLSAGTLATVLEGCKSGGGSKVGKDFAITPEHSEMIAEIAEMILPKTSTPGAKEAKVPEFIQFMLKECYKDEQQTAFFAGLDKLNEAAKGSFMKATAEEKLALLKAEDTAKEKSEFWQTMKDLTVLGYFTSEQGATQALEYLEVPTKYEPTKLQKGQKVWAMS